MALYTGILLFSVLAVVFAKKQGILPEKKIVLLAVIMEVSGMAIGAYDNYNNEVAFSGEIDRPLQGSEEIKEEYIAHSGEYEEEWEVSVSSRKPEDAAINKAIEKAKVQIDSTVFKNNKSADNVCEPLVICRSYADGMVNAEWSFSDPSLISANGSIDYNKLDGNAPVVVYASAALSCEGTESVYTFPFTLCMPQGSSNSGFRYYMEKALREANETEPEAKSIRLPDEAGGKEIVWTKPRDFRGALFMILGPLMAVAISLGKREEKKRAYQQRQRELSADYPEIVSALSLYVSAGITVRSAFARIYGNYCDRKRSGGIRDRPGYEVIGRMIRKMEDGEGEEAGYRLLTELTGHRDYGKLAMMLEKNIRHGAVHLAENLISEEARAFELRKHAARMLGEEASTKLLVPMLMLLAVVLAVLVSPAVMNLNM